MNRGKQATVVHRLKDINEIRNRLFHFEPIWDVETCKKPVDITKDIRKKYDLIMETLEWISKDICSYVDRVGASNHATTIIDTIENFFKTMSIV